MNRFILLLALCIAAVSNTDAYGPIAQPINKLPGMSRGNGNVKLPKSSVKPQPFAPRAPVITRTQAHLSPKSANGYVPEWMSMIPKEEMAKGFTSASLALAMALGDPSAALADTQINNGPTIITEPKYELPRNQLYEMKYSELIQKAQNHMLEKVSFTADGHNALAMDTDGRNSAVLNLRFDPNLVKLLQENGVDVTVAPDVAAQGMGGPLGSLVDGIFNFVVPFFILLAGFRIVGSLVNRVNPDAAKNSPFGQNNGPMGQMMNIGKSNAKVEMIPNTNTNFTDVAGCDEAKEELVEVVDFLKRPEKYSALGARIPRGVVLEGPPGTGKTLLARAVAGEAGVPFFSVSGSEFVEMFVGVGASRVRDLFKQAKENAPCIIFIDEIDAIGKQRASGAGGFSGGNDEREQTLNQILTEMDGFEGNAGVVVLAATNRADVLDNALLRPGRFDRRVAVNLADFAGRVAILKVHARNKPFAPDVNLEVIARRAIGFSGAQLQNLLNEAAIYAARDGAKEITYKNIDDALDRLVVGLAKKNRQSIPVDTKKLVAFHEAGHAIIGVLTPGYDDVSKVTIIPRSNGAGGITFFAPTEERLDSGLYSRQYLTGQIAVALGGRVAEELMLADGDVTTGASSDLIQVARTARNMVTAWGLSESMKLPPIAVDGQTQQNPFIAPESEWSPEVQSAVDEEIFKIVNEAYATARGLLMDHNDLLLDLAVELVENETVDGDRLKEKMKDAKAAMTEEKYNSYKMTSIPDVKTLYHEQFNSDKFTIEKLVDGKIVESPIDVPAVTTEAK